MDISELTDEKELKALAYDATVSIQIAQRNLQVIEQRLKQLQELQNIETQHKSE